MGIASRSSHSLGYCDRSVMLCSLCHIFQEWFAALETPLVSKNVELKKQKQLQEDTTTKGFKKKKFVCLYFKGNVCFPFTKNIHFKPLFSILNPKNGFCSSMYISTCN